MTLVILKARQEVSNRLATFRAIDRIINSNKFDILYSHATISDEEEILTAIKNADREAILRWIKKKSRELDFNEINIKELYGIARRLGIPNYGRLPKALLLFEINQRKHLDFAPKT